MSGQRGDVSVHRSPDHELASRDEELVNGGLLYVEGEVQGLQDRGVRGLLRERLAVEACALLGLLELLEARAQELPVSVDLRDRALDPQLELFDLGDGGEPLSREALEPGQADAEALLLDDVRGDLALNLEAVDAGL